MPFRLLLLAGLTSLPLLGTAQTTPNPPKFYVGLGANVMTELPFQQYRAPSIYSPALTAGVQLNPHWALQLGAGLGWQSEEFTSTINGANGNVYASGYKDRILSLPLLARYTFTASPTGRFRVDALGGVTLMRTTTTSVYTTYYAGDKVDESERAAYSYNTYSLTLGPAVRYALTPRVDLVANAVVNMVLNGNYYPSFSDRLYLNAQVGAHYTFGTR